MIILWPPVCLVAGFSWTILRQAYKKVSASENNALYYNESTIFTSPIYVFLSRMLY